MSEQDSGIYIVNPKDRGRLAICKGHAERIAELEAQLTDLEAQLMISRTGREPSLITTTLTMKSKIVMVKAMAHKGMTDMKRKDYNDWEEAQVSRRTVHPELGECFIGMYLTGIGAYNVHFPLDAARVATEEERTRLLKRRYVGCGQNYKLQPQDFADSLNEISTVVDWDSL
jgi:hypothetical protein